MYHTVYKTTNLINNKIYIGIHSTKEIYDNYIGSGKALLEAVKKYGKENFKKDILYVFKTRIQALKKEKELVCSEFIKLKDNYNLIIGGGSYEEFKREVCSKYMAKIGRKGGLNNKGKPKSEEHRRKMSKPKSGSTRKGIPIPKYRWKIKEPDGNEVVVYNLREYCKSVTPQLLNTKEAMKKRGYLIISKRKLKKKVA